MARATILALVALGTVGGVRAHGHSATFVEDTNHSVRNLAAPSTLPSFSLRDIAPSSGDVVRAGPGEYINDGKPTFLALFQGD